MALQLNLYHEIHRQAQERARDPFKLAGLAGLAIALLFVGYYFYRASVVSKVESSLASMQAEWKKLEPAKAKAKERESELLIQQKINGALVKRLQGRFYWASFLQEIAAVIPPEIQVLSLSGDFPRRGNPVNVIISGIAAGHQPRSVAEQFRLALAEKLSPRYAKMTATFDANSLEETTDMIEFRGESLASAKFRIRLTFEPEPTEAKVKAAAPAASPASRELKKTR